MPNPSFQTVQLGRGRHQGPELGACVMELASMLAGEPFSDAPTAVCPLIGSFLRTYNDSIDDDRRQDLYRYAAAVVGSGGNRRLTRARTRFTRAWIQAAAQRQFIPFALPGPLAPVGRVGRVAAYVALAGYREESHPQALQLLDRLIAIGREDATAQQLMSAAPAPLAPPSRGG